MTPLPQGLKLRGDVFWIDFRDAKGKRIRESCRTTDRAQAEKRLAQAKTEVFEQRFIPKADKPVLTLQQGFDRLMKLVWTQTKTPKTVQHNWNRLTGQGVGTEPHIDPHMVISELTETDLEEAIMSLRDLGYSNASINRSMSVLRSILIAARDRWKLITQVPKVPKERESQGRMRWLQDGEEELIVGWFRGRGDNDMGDLIELLLDTGCRLSEILDLDATAVNPMQRYIMLWNTKNGDWDRQPLTPRALQIFQRRIKIEGYPFRNLTRHAAIHRFQTMKKHCGFEKDEELCLHTMRHTTASRLVAGGLDLKRVQEFMRHRNIQTTMRYVKLDPKAKLEALKVLESVTKTCPKQPQKRSQEG